MDRRSFVYGAVTGAVVGSGGTALMAKRPEQKRPPSKKPVKKASSKEMVIVSSWPRDFPGLGTSSQRLAQRITDATDGQITTQYFAAGERVGAFDVFDEVANGNAQAYISADYYWKGKHPGWAFFTSVPFGLTYAEMSAWIFHLGGQQLWDELADGFNLKCLPCGSAGVQMGGWFNKEIDSTDDLKGLKIRIAGLGGDVLTKVGASAVSMPGGQIYENLISGTIDAVEWVGPYIDYFMKFYEATRYYYYPGMHEPGSFASLGMNKSWWSGLSKQEQIVLEAVCVQELNQMMAEVNALNGKYLQRLINEHGVQLREFSDEIYESFGEAAKEVFADVRAHSDLTDRIYLSFDTARTNVASWLKLADVGYSLKRNAVLGI